MFDDTLGKLRYCALPVGACRLEQQMLGLVLIAPDEIDIPDLCKQPLGRALTDTNSQQPTLRASRILSQGSCPLQPSILR